MAQLLKVSGPQTIKLLLITQAKIKFKFSTNQVNY